jgi:hypothetical protein
MIHLAHQLHMGKNSFISQYYVLERDDGVAVDYLARFDIGFEAFPCYLR